MKNFQNYNVEISKILLLSERSKQNSDDITTTIRDKTVLLSADYVPEKAI